MIDQSSRYYGFDMDNEIKILINDDGNEIRYLKRRIIKPATPFTKPYVIKGNERLDLIAYQQLGDPLQFWKICDANNALHPLELIRKPGDEIKIPDNLGFAI